MIQKINISELKENPNNPRFIKDDKFKKLVKSIKEFPEMLKLRPIVVDNDMVVLGGNMRLKALKNAGIKETYYIKAENLTEEQKKEFVIKDNVGFGEWDFDLLANEFEPLQLEDWGLDLPDMGDLEEIDEPDVPFSGELKETSQYVVLYFENEIDWLTAKEKLNLDTVKCNDSKKGYDRKGINRLINGNFILDKIKD